MIGIAAGSLGAMGALLSVGGAYPWWSLGVFFLCCWIVYGIIVYGEESEAADGFAVDRSDGHGERDRVAAREPIAGS